MMATENPAMAERELTLTQWARMLIDGGSNGTRIPRMERIFADRIGAHPCDPSDRCTIGPEMRRPGTHQLYKLSILK